jgi:hypothetical protein
MNCLQLQLVDKGKPFVLGFSPGLKISGGAKAQNKGQSTSTS